MSSKSIMNDLEKIKDELRQNGKISQDFRALFYGKFPPSKFYENYCSMIKKNRECRQAANDALKEPDSQRSAEESVTSGHNNDSVNPPVEARDIESVTPDKKTVNDASADDNVINLTPEKKVEYELQEALDALNKALLTIKKENLEVFKDICDQMKTPATKLKNLLNEVKKIIDPNPVENLKIKYDDSESE